MLQAFINIWKIRDLRNKILFTLGMLAIYRVGFFIPLPGVNQAEIRQWAERASEGALGNLITYVGIFTGGSFQQSTVFGLGIMPYISAAIIFQLLGTVYEPLKQLQKEGPAGRQKIQEWTRYATVGLCLIQAAFYLKFLSTPGGDGAPPLVYSQYLRGWGLMVYWLCGTLGLTAGTVFLMWLGEQIDKYGIGNGISLIISAGIIAGMPTAINMIVAGFSTSGGDVDGYGIDTILFLLASFILVVAGSIVITQGQRRIPIQQAKHTRGRKVYGGQRSYLPLRVNHGGVMPIIFASSLMIFPSILIGWMAGAAFRPGDDAGWLHRGYWSVVEFLSAEFSGFHGYLYTVIYIALIYFFSYFWTSVQFQPKEVAENLRDSGSFIPGLRPGPRTAEYLETVMERITYVGAGFLSVIAIVPTIVSGLFAIPFQVTQFLGGTGLLIVVSVMLDFVQRIEANLLMRNYQGFLGSGGGRIKGGRTP